MPRWGGVCLRGLLLDGRRKSVEPMAARLGEDGNRQALAHFITSSPWEAALVRARLAWQMQQVIKPGSLAGQADVTLPRKSVAPECARL